MRGLDRGGGGGGGWILTSEMHSISEVSLHFRKKSRQRDTTA